ncbi:hypothetical protein B9Z55_018695 [Caenorhabditis nigoni]|uniref:Uncharacterized protein n=1 Tax=Caenorhabditis nigoni TaxID=1611254 RepID=A0A2G5TF48_9PELO|nr:hypothetical protein B9Z55_018695 [Caenorhabditis nigoni]
MPHQTILLLYVSSFYWFKRVDTKFGKNFFFKKSKKNFLVFNHWNHNTTNFMFRNLLGAEKIATENRYFCTENAIFGTETDITRLKLTSGF